MKPRWSSRVVEDYFPPTEAEFLALAELLFGLAVVSESVKVMGLKPIALASLRANGLGPFTFSLEIDRELADFGSTWVLVRTRDLQKKPRPLQLESPSAMA